MLSKRYSHLIRLFAIISLSYFLAGCGDGDGPTPVPGEPCQGESLVTFDADSYPENAASAIITLTDSCVGLQTVNLLVDTGSDNSISVAASIDARGIAEPVTIQFGPTDDETDTIAIKEGDTLTATYTDANAVNQTATASITEESSTLGVTLGVYSETNITPLLNSNITNSADLGGKDTVTTEVAAGVVIPLEGDKSLQATFEADDPVSGSNNNGFAFDFARPISNGANDLINSSFETPDASAGDEDCVLVADSGTATTPVPGWKCFNGAFIASNLFKPGGPTDVQNATAVDGSQLIKLFNKDGLAQQSITVAAGDNVNASVYAMSWTGDVFNNLFILQLAFFDAGDTQVGVKEVYANSVGGVEYLLEPKDGGEAADWTLMEVSEVAPAGTVRAQILMIQILTDGTPDTGSVSLDSARLYVGAYDPAPPLVDSVDILSYETLKFGINTTASSGLMDLEVKMEDESLASASVFLSAYTPSETTGDWALYEIPLDEFGSTLDRSQITSLGFYNASTVVNTDPAYPTLFDTTLYFDDVHFEKASTTPDVLTGVLVDTPVEGVTFVTATQLGITNVDGRFAYIDGEMVTFSVGGIVLGTVAGAPLISPVELSGAVSSIDQVAINLMVFLQSIDEDQNLFNGITITQATRDAAATQTLDFTLDSAAFTSAVAPVVTAITSVNPDGPNTVVSETTALDNFYVTYVFGGVADTYSYSFPPQYPAYPGTDACLPVDFEAGGCPYFIADFYGVETTVIDNPDTTGNSSAKVAQVQKFAYSPETFGGSVFVLGTTDFSAGEVFTMKVWASRPVPVTFKLEGLDEQRVVTHSGSGAWEELIFDFTGFTTGPDVTLVTVFFDIANAGDAAGNPADWTFYIDDIALTESSSIPITYQLIWSDEFDVDGVPDSDNWTIDTGYGDNGWGNNEWQLYTTSPDNIKVETGNLVITANCSLATTAPENCGVRDGTITSGKVITQDKFSFRYGKVEARIKPPVGKASWPAFWMLGANFSDVGWPMTGEIDIVEMHNFFSDDKTTHFTMHWCDESVAGAETCIFDPDTNTIPGWIYISKFLSFSDSLGDDYHLFSAEWDASGVTGKIDGIPYYYLAIDPVTMDEFLKEFFLILNVAMGGTLGSDQNPPDGTETWPQIMLVDYVRVYQDVNNSDSTSTIGGGAPLEPLGVYSETNTDPAIAYEISIATGGKDTVIDENSSDTVLEGAISLKAEYKSTGSGSFNWNGFDFNFGSSSSGNLLLNGDIEAVDASGGDISGVFDWTTFETVFTNSTIGPASGPVSHDAGGTQSIKMYGPFNPNGAAGAFQPVDVVAGETYDLTAYAMSWNSDPVGLGNVGILQLSFWDGPGASGNQLGGNIEFLVDSDPSSANTTLTPQDGADISDWTEMSVSGVAPAGAVSAQAFLLHIQSGAGGVGGSIFFDDVSLSEVAVAGADISAYDTLKFGINTAAASGFMDLEVKMEDPVLGSASVFLSAYTPSPSGVANWDIYEIPLSDFTNVDKTQITSLGFWSASSTITGSTAVEPELLDGIIYFDDIHFKVGLPVGGGPNLLLNGDIEAVDASGGDISGVFDWTTFETVFTNSTIGPASGPVSHDAGGTQSIKMYGPFNPNGAAGAFQPVDVVAGDTYDLTAYAMSWVSDPVGLGNVGILQLSFWDGPGASGNQLGSNIEFVVDSDASSANTTLTPQDGADISDWTQMSVSGVAPAGAVSAQAFLLHIQSGAGGVGGSIFFDDVSLRAR